MGTGDKQGDNDYWINSIFTIDDLTTAIGVNIDLGHDHDQELHMTVTELMTNDLTSIQDVVAFCRDGNANHVIQKIMETAEDLRKSFINRKINQVHSIFFYKIPKLNPFYLSSSQESPRIRLLYETNSID